MFQHLFKVVDLPYLTHGYLGLNLFLEVRHLKKNYFLRMCLINSSFGRTVQTIFVSLMKTFAYSYNKSRKCVWQNQADYL